VIRLGGWQKHCNLPVLIEHRAGDLIPGPALQQQWRAASPLQLCLFASAGTQFQPKINLHQHCELNLAVSVNRKMFCTMWSPSHG